MDWSAGWLRAAGAAVISNAAAELRVCGSGSSSSNRSMMRMPLPATAAAATARPVAIGTTLDRCHQPRPHNVNVRSIAGSCVA